MIDVFVPVLARPKNAQPLVDSFRAHSSQIDEIHFICSPGDDAQIEACMQTSENLLIVDWDPGPGDYARKMNHAFSVTDRPYVFLGADDIEFSPNWSERALQRNTDVVATNDQANRQVQKGVFGTHCLVRRSYVEELGGSADGPGTLVHEGYDHNFPDRELCALAKSRGVFSYAADSIVRHRHPLWNSAPWDDTYRKAMENFHQDLNLFLERSALWDYAGLSVQEQNVARRKKRYTARR